LQARQKSLLSETVSPKNFDLEADESAANETVASEANDSDASETVSPKDSVPRLVFVFYPKIATAPPSTLLSRPSFLDATDRKAEQEAANQIKLMYHVRYAEKVSPHRTTVFLPECTCKGHNGLKENTN
jgi:hypothetical protein